VTEVIHHFGFPGMKILLFAFGDDLSTNLYAPHNLERNCLVYTGTHDNNTARGWFEKEITPEVEQRICRYIGKEVSGESIGRELIRLAMMSVADAAIFPMQDLLGLGEDSRMNKPATHEGNWEWRLDPELLTPSVADELLIMTQIYGRG
jgi:4-alpha-glucanotransferase